MVQTHKYFPLHIHIELSPSSNIHTEYSYFPWFINFDRAYIPNNVISLGLQILNPQQPGHLQWTTKYNFNSSIVYQLQYILS
jgi:hypothetical protein